MIKRYKWTDGQTVEFPGDPILRTHAVLIRSKLHITLTYNFLRLPFLSSRRAEQAGWIMAPSYHQPMNTALLAGEN